MSDKLCGFFCAAVVLDFSFAEEVPKSFKLFEVDAVGKLFCEEIGLGLVLLLTDLE